MTSDEILNEPAGPRMDAWVTEYVMGVKPRDVRVCGSDEIVTVYNANKSFIDGGWGKLDLLRYGTPPNYSTDIAAAWEVVERMKKAGCTTKLSVYRGHGYWCEFSNQPPLVCAGSEDDDSMPLAICRAALLTTLEE